MIIIPPGKIGAIIIMVLLGGGTLAFLGFVIFALVAW